MLKILKLNVFYLFNQRDYVRYILFKRNEQAEKNVVNTSLILSRTNNPKISQAVQEEAYEQDSIDDNNKTELTKLEIELCIYNF